MVNYSDEFSRNLAYAEIYRRNIPVGLDINILGNKEGKWTFDILEFTNWNLQQLKDGNYKSVKKSNYSYFKIETYILISIGETYGKDRFFIMSGAELQDILYEKFMKWVNRPGERRPLKSKSFFQTITDEDIIQYENNWKRFSTPMRF